MAANNLGSVNKANLNEDNDVNSVDDGKSDANKRRLTVDVNVTINANTNSNAKARQLRVNQDIDFQQGIVGVFGQTGVGKTSVFKCLAGFAQNGFCHSLWQGQTLAKDMEKNPCLIQLQDNSLFPAMTVLQNLEFVQKHSSWAASFSLEQVCQWCEITPLLNLQVSQLSGGQKQQVTLARSLLSGKPVVILDEPFSAMDWTLRQRFCDLLKQLHHEYRLNFILISHSIRELASCCSQAFHFQMQTVEFYQDFAALLHALQYDEAEHHFSRLALEKPELNDEFDLLSWRLAGTQQRVFSHTLQQQPQQFGVIEANQVTLVNMVNLLPHQDDYLSSALNHLQGTVTKLRTVNGRVLVQLDLSDETNANTSPSLNISQVGQPQELLAEISEYSVKRLKLEIGQTIVAQFKSL